MSYQESPVSQAGPGKHLVQCHHLQAALWLTPDVSRTVERRPCNDGSCKHAGCPLYDNRSSTP
jgi:hypothetical protein